MTSIGIVYKKGIVRHQTESISLQLTLYVWKSSLLMIIDDQWRRYTRAWQRQCKWPAWTVEHKRNNEEK